MSDFFTKISFVLLAALIWYLILFSPGVSYAAPDEKAALIEEIKLEAWKANIDPTTTLLIAKCESGLDPQASAAPKSSAGGIFQFLHGTFQHYGKLYWGNLDYKEKDRFNPHDNIILAVWVIKNYGVKDWSESASCWS